jgi:uncharacterized protein (TIGR01244 family)
VNAKRHRSRIVRHETRVHGLAGALGLADSETIRAGQLTMQYKGFSMRYIHILIIILATSVAGQPAAADGSGIPYQTQPREHLMVGGQPTLAQLEALRDGGYSTVVNLRRAGEFDTFDEAAEVARLGMEYVHIPVRNVESITRRDARALHEAISNAPGPVLLHCTIGWRAGGLFAIENYLLHGASRQEALDLAAAAHMEHVAGDVAQWIRAHRGK